jgi:hypothetical protein
MKIENHPRETMPGNTRQSENQHGNTKHQQITLSRPAEPMEYKSLTYEQAKMTIPSRTIYFHLDANTNGCVLGHSTSGSEMEC